MKIRLLSASAIAALSLGAGHAARAQSIDYGSLEQLFNEPVTTSATGSPERVTEAPVDMTIITADDIRRSGATDLPTILSRVPGMDVLNWSAGHSDVSVRGYDQVYSPRLLVLINGREVYLDHYGYTAWSNLPVELGEIRQIEVVRGPNSALFGFNAVGGVINIITFDPKYDDTNSVEIHGGAHDDVGGSVVQTVHLGDRISARFSVGGERRNEWDNAYGFPDPWSAHAMGDALVRLAPNTDLRLQGSWSRSSEIDRAPNSTYGPARTATRSIDAALTSETPYGEIQAQAYVNDLKFLAYVGPLPFDLRNRNAVVSLQDLFKIGTRSTFRIGLEFRDNRINTAPISGGHVGYRVWAPSAMWSYAASSNLSLTAAARLDALQLRRSGPIAAGLPFTNKDWDQSSDSFSINLGVVYRLDDLTTLRATYARGIQPPSLINYGGLQASFGPAPFGVALSGNPRLKPAVVSNYQLSYDRTLPDLGARFSAKVFFQETDDIQGQGDLSAPSLPPTATTYPTSFAGNVSTSKMTGFELAASGKTDGGFHWNADTTYTDVNDTPTGITYASLVTRGVAFADTTPKIRGNVALGWSDERWEVDGYLHYVSDFQTYAPVGIAAAVLVRTPGYVSLGGRIGYQISDGLVIALSGQNLGRAHQPQGTAGGLQAPRRVILSLTKSW